MSLDKAIEHGKEHRKPYRKAQAVDTHCRCHGPCKWCMSNRTIQSQKELARTKETLEADGTLILETSFDATKVGRVLVCNTKEKIGNLYYLDDDDD